jgi:hypothetical protein
MAAIGKNLPPGLQTAIKRGTVAEIIRAENATVDVDTSVWAKQAYRKKNRDLLLKEGRYNLLQCSFDPNGTFHKDTPTVSVWLYGIPSDAWREASVSAEQIPELLRECVILVSEKQGWHAHWSLDILWNVPKRQLEMDFVFNKETRGERAIHRMIDIKSETDVMRQ